MDGGNIGAYAGSGSTVFLLCGQEKRGYPMKNAFEGKIKEAVFVRQTMDI
jgi:4-diphosphocytidyl-2C-methyl-D-erythritol kinase